MTNFWISVFLRTVKLHLKKSFSFELDLESRLQDLSEDKI